MRSQGILANAAEPTEPPLLRRSESRVDALAEVHLARTQREVTEDALSPGLAANNVRV